MNTVGIFAASLAAASAAVIATANTVLRSASDPPSSSEHGSGSAGKKGAAGLAENKFAPRFDGLRFIETLVTAHRHSKVRVSWIVTRNRKPKHVILVGMGRVVMTTTTDHWCEQWENGGYFYYS